MKELLLGVMLPAVVIALPAAYVAGGGIAAEATTAVYEVYEEYIPIEEYEEYEDETPAIFRTTARLNLRSGPGTNYTRIMTSNMGQLVHVTDFRDGEWFAVEVNGQAGYMFANFLVEVEDIAAALAEANSPVERREGVRPVLIRCGKTG